MTRNKIFSKLDLDNLLEHDQVRRDFDPNSGWIWLHHRRRLLPCDVTDSYVPPDGRQITPAPTTPENPSLLEDYDRVPLYLKSVETLRFVGFTEERADEIFDKYKDHIERTKTAKKPERSRVTKSTKNRPERVSFWTFVMRKAIPRGTRDAYREDDHDRWAACVHACGIATGLAQVVLEYRMSHAGRSGSCQFCIVGILQLRMDDLLSIQMASLARARALANKQNYQGLEQNE